MRGKIKQGHTLYQVYGYQMKILLAILAAAMVTGCAYNTKTTTEHSLELCEQALVQGGSVELYIKDSTRVIKLDCTHD